MPRHVDTLLERLGTLIERVRAEQFEVAEDTGLFSVDRRLVTTVNELVGASAALMLEIQELFDAETERSEGTVSPTQIPEPRAAVLSPREIADLAFLSRSEMLGLLTYLVDAARDRKVWKVLSWADTALTRSERAMIALESAIREREGLEAKDRVWLNLEDALEIRRQYALLRRTLIRADHPTGAELIVGLSRALDHIETLRRHRSYPLMRIDDRRQIRALQKRIMTALRDSDHTSDEDRRRLWQDLFGCVSLLMGVNNREELVDHDRRIVIETFDDLSRRRGRSDLPVDRLRGLIGRDADLDQALLEPEHVAPSERLARLRRIAQQLAPETVN